MLQELLPDDVLMALHLTLLFSSGVFANQQQIIALCYSTA